MTLADDLKPVVFNARGLVGEFGLRPYRVEVVVRHPAGSHVGDGGYSESVTPITEAGGQPPKIRWLNAEQRALLNVGHAVVEVGPITPEFSGGGTQIGTLTGAAFSLQEHDQFFYRLTGPEFPSGALFRLREVKSDKTFGYRVQLELVTIER